MPAPKGYKRKHGNLDTYERIHALAAYRARQIQETGQAPVWTTASNRMNINLRTVLLHAPKLAQYWYDASFIGSRQIMRVVSPWHEKKRSKQAVLPFFGCGFLRR